jgi:hypothetical protein
MAGMATAAYPGRRNGGIRESHRFLVAVLLVLATLAVIVGSFAVWVDRQLLDTSDWTDTSTQLIANPTIRQTVGTFVVEQVFQDTKLDRRLGSDPASRRATRRVKRFAAGLVARELATAGGMKTWLVANRQAHRELLRILNGDHTLVSRHGGDVVLNLDPLVDDVTNGLADEPAIAAVIGNHPGELVGGLVPHAGRVVIMRSTQLQEAQDGVNAIRGLAVVLPVAALVMFALALLLARAWRRRVIHRIGWCLIVAGACVFALRLLLGSRLVDSLITAGWVRPAAKDAWLIATTDLRTSAYITIAVGMGIVVVAWLTGRARPVPALRRF